MTSDDGHMRLSRRDALLALAGMGAASAYIGSTVRGEVTDLDEDAVVDRLQAAAEVIYPSAVEVTRSFIETYVRGRLRSREQHLRAQAATLADLDAHARHLGGRPFTRLGHTRRQSVFRRLGVHRAPPVPDGTTEERIRFYVVNDLLYVLFSTPVGGRLVGCENPPGHPGGRSEYRWRPVQ